MVDILNIKETMCWYPSSGIDFQAIKHWEKNMGNSILPEHFIFTDCDFSFMNNKISYFNNNISLPDNFVLIDQIQFTNINRNLNESEMDIEKKEYFHKNRNKINQGIIDLIDLGLVDYDSPSVLDYSEIEKSQKYVSLALIKHKDKHIYLLDIKNEDFYKHCASSQINIDALMFNRPIDEFILNPLFETELIHQLNIKEGIVGPNYTIFQNNDEIKNSENKWYQDFEATDKVAYIKYSNL